MQPARFPYGLSNFEKVVTEGYLYVDRTAYIERLEQLNSRYNFFLRPRRFGKSLFVSVLQYYYGKQHRADFERLFGPYYIGQNPTPRANGYLVLKFDFSGILTDRMEQVFDSFANNVRGSILESLIPYESQLPEDELAKIESAASPSDAMNTALRLIEKHFPGEKVLVLIDEYDHFTNEIIAFHFDNFRAIVSQNGFVFISPKLNHLFRSKLNHPEQPVKEV